MTLTSSWMWRLLIVTGAELSHGATVCHAALVVVSDIVGEDEGHQHVLVIFVVFGVGQQEIDTAAPIANE